MVNIIGNYDPLVGDEYQYGAALRFRLVDIPSHATITSAFVRFEAEANSLVTGCTTRIYAEKRQSPPLFDACGDGYETPLYDRMESATGLLTDSYVDWARPQLVSLNTGLTYMELGKHVQALNSFRESLVAFRKVGQRPNMEEYGGTAGFRMALVSSYSQGHMPSPFIRQEVTVLMNIAKCAKLLKRYSESDSARDEAAALVNEYGLQDMVEVVRALYEKE